jgi:C1A family cysteine protease
MLCFSRAALLVTLSVAVVAAVSVAAIPRSVDWRRRGVVPPVKDQGPCGSASLFAAMANIASVSAITNGDKFVPLSYTEVETCNPTSCAGGLMSSTYRWILEKAEGRVLKAGGGFNGNCSDINKAPISQVGAKIVSVINLARNEQAIAKAVAESGPVFVAVDATSWETYTGGVETRCTFQQVDHAAVVVGYDMDAQPPYWILQSSWGTSWGEEGYIRVAYGSNQCGIASGPTTVRADKL